MQPLIQAIHEARRQHFKSKANAISKEVALLLDTPLQPVVKDDVYMCDCDYCKAEQKA